MFPSTNGGNEFVRPEMQLVGHGQAPYPTTNGGNEIVRQQQPSSDRFDLRLCASGYAALPRNHRRGQTWKQVQEKLEKKNEVMMLLEQLGRLRAKATEKFDKAFD